MSAWLRTTGLRLLLAVGLGFSLWGYVAYVASPDRRRTFEGVPVAERSTPDNLVIVDQNGLPASLPTVSVVAEADQSTVADLRASDFETLVDLSGEGPGVAYNVPVLIRPTRNLGRVEFAAAPATLDIRLDQIITRTVPISVQVSGDPPFSFERGEVQVSQANRPIVAAQVRGPQNQVERVLAAQALVNIEGRTANYSSPARLTPVDADAQEVRGVTIEPAAINIEVPINATVGIKRVPVVPQISGQPGSGFVVTNISVAPQLVSLTGSSGPLDNIDQVQTEPVSINGATASFTRTVALLRPDEANFRAGEATSAVVTVEVVPIQRPFSITLPVPVQLSDIPAGLLASFSPAVIDVTLSGPAELLPGLDTRTIAGVVSLGGLRAGSYTLQPAMQLPEGVQVVGEPPRVIVSLRVPASATPPPSTTPRPSATPRSTDTPAPPEPPPTETPPPPDTPAPPEPPPTEAPTPDTPPTTAPVSQTVQP